jgi:hypothetical protein
MENGIVNPVKGNEAQIDQANKAMWAMPWYQDLMRQWGQSPQNTKLSDNQRRIVMDTARQNGFDVSKEFEVDPSGNFNPKGHKLRNTLIVAGIAGATIATMGAAGAFSGGALAASSTVPSTGALAGGLASGTSAAGAGLSLGGAAAGGAGAAGTAAGVGGALGSTAIGSGFIPGVGLASGSSASGAGIGGGIIQGAGAAGKGGSTISNLIGKAGKYSDIAQDAGQALGAYGQGEANNRTVRGNFTQDWDKMMLEATQDRRVAEADAMKKLQQGQYLQGGGSQFKMPTYQLNGQSRTPTAFGTGPTAPTDVEKQAAKTLEGQLIARLQPGAGWKPSPLESYTQPGTAEKVGKWGSAIGTGLGLIGRYFGK